MLSLLRKQQRQLQFTQLLQLSANQERRHVLRLLTFESRALIGRPLVTVMTAHVYEL